MKPLITLALAALAASSFAVSAQSRPATPPNTSGLFQPPAPKPVVPGKPTPPTAGSPAGAPARGATPAQINAVQAQANKPMSFSADSPYERCQATIASLKKLIPTLTQQVLADRLVASYSDGQASYQHTCTRSGKMTSTRTPNGMTTPAPVAAPASTARPTAPVKTAPAAQR